MPTIAAKTNYMAQAILNHLLSKDEYTPPSTMYVGLYDVDPGKAGTDGTEVTGGGYARQPVTFGDVSGEGVVVNSEAVIFPDVTSPWGSVAGFALLDAETGGNILYRGDLERMDPDNPGEYIPQATTPAVGDVFIIKAGQLVLSER
ncbi:MAG: hypothetical protein LBP61_08275 [Desulfovibrio sp.]|jgi:hypothetical protein|nr:hypothetical protein [Desulfovibrio sp.]